MTAPIKLAGRTDSDAIAEQIIQSLRGFDASNWLYPVGGDQYPGHHLLGEIVAEHWDNPEARQFAAEHGCIGYACAAMFKLPFDVVYEQVRQVYNARFGDGWWEANFKHPVGSRERQIFEENVRTLLPILLVNLSKIAGTWTEHKSGVNRLVKYIHMFGAENGKEPEKLIMSALTFNDLGIGLIMVPDNKPPQAATPSVWGIDVVFDGAVPVGEVVLVSYGGPSTKATIARFTL